MVIKLRVAGISKDRAGKMFVVAVREIVQILLPGRDGFTAYDLSRTALPKFRHGLGIIIFDNVYYIL